MALRARARARDATVESDGNLNTKEIYFNIEYAPFARPSFSRSAAAELINAGRLTARLISLASERLISAETLLLAKHVTPR